MRIPLNPFSNSLWGIRCSASLIVVWSITCAISMEASTGIFRYSGSVQYTILPQTKEESDLTLSFDVDVFGTAWRIRTTDPSSNRPASTYLFSGEKLYFLRDFSGTRLTNPETPADRKGTVEIKRTYTIRPGEFVPSFDVDLAFPIWLALLSGRYFGNSNTCFPDFRNMGPNGLMPAARASLKANVERRLFRDGWLPAAINFEETPQFLDPPIGSNRPLQARQAGICADYRTLAWNSVAEREYPVKAVLQVLGPLGRRDTNRTPITRTIIEIRDATYLPDGSLPNQPAIAEASTSAPALVRDFTITSHYGTPVYYRTMTGFLTTGSANLSNVIRASDKLEEQRRRQMPPSGSARSLFLIVLSGSLVAPAALFGYKLANKSKAKNPDTK